MDRRITKTLGTSLATLIVLFSFAPISFAASEVHGTLSSDGSSGTTRQEGNAGGAPSASLGGTVMGGSDDNESMAALAGFAEDRDTIMLLSIILPLSLLVAGFGFLLYRRRI